MTRVALKGLASRPLRTILTALAIVLGVGMVSAAFTLTDTMRGAANSLSSAAYDGTDAVVSAQHRVQGRLASDCTDPAARRVAAALLAKVRARAAGRRPPSATSPTRRKIIGRDGKPVGDGPYFGTGFDAPHPGRREARRAFRLAVRPLGDRARARSSSTPPRPRSEHYAVGSTRAASTRAARPRTFRVVGIARFGTVKSLGTATIAVFDLETAQTLFHKQGRYDSILVGRQATAPRGADVRRARRRRGRPTRQVQTAAAHDRFTLDGLKQFIGIIKVVLLVFGGVAILVGAFTIFNTLSITVAQRTREFAMLRMVGAARRQVLGSVLLEALALGVWRVDRRPRRGLRPGRGPERRCFGALDLVAARRRAWCSRRARRSWRCSSARS